MKPKRTLAEKMYYAACKNTKQKPRRFLFLPVEIQNFWRLMATVAGTHFSRRRR